MRVFYIKSCKIAAALGAPPFLALKNSSNNSANALLLRLPRFCPYFSFQNSTVFVGGGAKVFLLQGAGYPSYATGENPQNGPAKMKLLNCST